MIGWFKKAAEKAAIRRGTPLGAPFHFEWTDPVPTKKTWSDLADERASTFGILAFGGLVLLCYKIWGEAGAFFGGLYVCAPLAALVAMIARDWGRADNEPVPEDIRRTAFIECVDGAYQFVVLRNGVPSLAKPWEEIEHFEVTDYWSMFRDSGKNPYNTAWHAVIMTPRIGKPWLIGSTMGSKDHLREVFTELDARFGAATRATFLRDLKKPSHQGPTSVEGDAVDGVPSAL